MISWLYLTLPETSVLATTKGLNQIVTPDVQPQGDLSLSFQWQGQEIANPYEFQAELGLTKWFEVAIFQGLKPQETIFGCEVGLVQKDPWLLTTGFVNCRLGEKHPSPFSKPAIIRNTISLSLEVWSFMVAQRRCSVTLTTTISTGVSKLTIKAEGKTSLRPALRGASTTSFK